jgi:glyoxylase-like metal-dependent hydrolase (beta-lactamase superfamily II)
MFIRAKLTLAVTSLLLTGLANASFAQAPEPTGGGIEPGVLPVTWMASGPKCMEVPDWQVHEYNANFYIIRQSGCLDYEKPFLYLIFGKDRGLLLDTGSRNFPAAAMVEAVVGKWLKRNGRKQIELLVVHSHPHSDHVAGDEQLKSLKSTSITVKLIPATLEATKELYGISNWPDQAGSVDLGGRVLDAIAIPGHSPVSIALYDRQTAILLTGDSLYPGRLYVHDWDDFVKSTGRLVAFTKGRLVAHILGCHVEQSRTPYLDYPMGTVYQLNEHALAMSRGDLLELMDALASLHGPTRLAMRDFSIWPIHPDSVPHGKALEDFKTREKEQMKHMWNQPPVQ